MNNYIEEFKKGLSLPREIIEDVSTEIETHIYYHSFINKDTNPEDYLGPSKELAKSINKTKILGISEIMKLKSTRKLLTYFLIFNIFWVLLIVFTNFMYGFGGNFYENTSMTFIQRLLGDLSMLSTLSYILSYGLLYFITIRKFKSYTQIALVTLLSSPIVFGGTMIVEFVFVSSPIYSFLMINPVLEYAIFLNTIMLPCIIIGKEYFKKAKDRDDKEMLIN